MMKWINFLHIYQPPYQDADVTKKVTRESYWTFLDILQKNPKAKITLNFSGSLLENLYNVRETKLIEAFGQLVANKQIELVGSAKYHPILPLLPPSEIMRQIQLNEEILKEAFGKYYQPTGFFLPEMAYSPRVARIVKSLGYQWILLDEISYGQRFGLVDYNKKYKIKNIGLQVVFRNRTFSKTFPPQTVLDLTKKSNPPQYVITATDGEIYGHHHKNFEYIFSKSLSNPQIKTMTVSEYLEDLPKRSEFITPAIASWETTEKDLQNKLPFALWDNPKNKIHKQLWELRKIAIRLISQAEKKDVNYEWARHHLDRGLASCAWWWAADRELDVFNFVTWHPENIEKGIKELISSIRSLETLRPENKLRAEKIYHQLIREIWKKHWTKYSGTTHEKGQSVTVKKKALMLLDPNFITSFFRKKIDRKIIGTAPIDYVNIKTFKNKIRPTFYHVVVKYTIYYKNKKKKPISIYCSAHSSEPRKGAYDALSYIFPRGFAEGNLRSPMPLFFSKNFNAFFYIGPEGKNLYQYITDKKVTYGQIRTLVILTAEWLAKLHTVPTKSAKNFNPLQNKIKTFIPGPKHLLETIKRKHKRYPKYYRESKALFEKLVALEENMPKREKSIIHGDIHPENVIPSPHEKNTVSIIDYTDCCLADFTRDLANFLQQFAYMSRKSLSTIRVSALQKLFLRKYAEAKGVKKLTRQDQGLIYMYHAWTALRSAMFFLTISTFDRPRADQLFIEAKKYLAKMKRFL